jgi:hypothetical protein
MSSFLPAFTNATRSVLCWVDKVAVVQFIAPLATLSTAVS